CVQGKTSGQVTVQKAKKLPYPGKHNQREKQKGHIHREGHLNEHDAPPDKSGNAQCCNYSVAKLILFQVVDHAPFKMAPSLISIIRSLLLAKSGSCVTAIIVCPIETARSLRIPKTISVLALSTLPVGSSPIIMAGSLIRALA